MEVEEEIWVFLTETWVFLTETWEFLTELCILYKAVFSMSNVGT